jgi:hypothetical protein
VLSGLADAALLTAVPNSCLPTLQEVEDQEPFKSMKVMVLPATMLFRPQSRT